MGYYDTAKYCRSELKRSIQNGDAYGAKLNCITYIKLLKKSYELISSYKDKAYILNSASQFEELLKVIDSEGISQRVKAVDVDGDRLVIPPSGTAGVKKAEAPPAAKKSAPLPPAPAKKAANGDPIAANISKDAPVEIPFSKPVEPPPPAKQEPEKPKPTEAPPALPKADLPKDDLPKDAEPAHAEYSEEWNADLFEKYLPATAVIQTSSALGTGFFISSKGYILTNHHVVHTRNILETNITVTTGDKKYYSKVEFIAADKKYDLALLKINSPETKVFPLIPLIEDYSQVRTGSNMMIIGNGLGYGLAPITGIIKFTKHYDNNLVYTAPTNSGDSGSPVINRSGFCIGIHKSRDASAKSRGVAFATSANEIRSMLETWTKQYNLNI